MNEECVIYFCQNVKQTLLLVNKTLLMKNPLLLPYRFKWIGLVLFIPFAALFIANLAGDFEFAFLQFKDPKPGKIFTDTSVNLTDEVALGGLILSLIFMSLAKEKREDEYINNIRLQSFQLAVIINYILLMIIVFSSYGPGFLVLLYVNIPLLLVFFLALFYTRLKLIPHFFKTRLA